MKKLMVLIAAMTMVAGFAMTAAAADWDFYGSARVSTFYVDNDGFDGSYVQGLQGNSRIGANVKVSDELTGRFEYGTGVNVRILWGEWNFGAGSLGVGQHYTPLNFFYSNQVWNGDAGLLNNGGVYSGRQAMLRLKFGDFQIAAVQAPAGQNDAPTLEAKYIFKFDTGSVALAGAYDVGPDNGDAAYVIALGGSMNLGMFSISGNIWGGDYADQLMWTNSAGESAFGYLIAAGFTVNDMIKFEAGYGYVEGDDSGDTKSYYLQMPLTLAPGVYVVPEIGVDNDGDTNYFGAKWQINF